MTNLVRVSQAEKAGLPFKPSTFYDWKHTGKHPEIFISLGGALFVDRDRLQELLEAHRGGKAASRGRRKAAS